MGEQHATATFEYRQSKKRLMVAIGINVLLGLFLWRGVALGLYLIWLPALFVLLSLISYFYQHITIDGDAITLTAGLFAQSTTEIPLDKINAVTVRRGLLGQALGYGNLVIFTGNDKSGIKFAGLDQPDEVKRLLKNR
jgi:uncharacterized membrane protein YdbT with pleckstrin-like domain